VLPDGADGAAAAHRVAAAAADAQVIYLGEQHDNPAHHRHQRAVLEALLAEGVRPSVAFEMLSAGQQPVVDAALAERPTEAQLAERLGWREAGWPDFSMYWPLFELALRDRLPILALDLDRAVTRGIVRDGLAAAGPDADRLRSLLPADAAREADIHRVIVEAHCGLLPAERVPRMVEAWHARNVGMARRIAGAVDDGRRVAVIVGRGHQAPGGLPDQLAALRPGTRQFVLDLVEAPSGQDRPALAAGSTANAVWPTPAVTRPDPCAPLRKRTAAPAAGALGRHAAPSVDRLGSVS
jgi:uncharacterized iron-regulated protein